MLNHSAPSYAKQLELISVHWDIARASMQMPVVPLHITVLSAGKPVPEDDQKIWNMLKFDFNPETPVDTRAVVSARKKEWELCIDVSDCRSVYYPQAASHPAFESMYPTCFPDEDVCGLLRGKRVLVLRQEKINDDVPSAVRGLNKAADLLKKSWKGYFLFIITAMGAKKSSTIKEAKHPCLFITRENSKEFFSPSFAPLAEVEYWQHLHRETAREL